MEVIYKGNSKRLIKNHIYKVERLYNSGNNNIFRWMEGKVEIKDLGFFKATTFTDLEGNPLPNIDYGKPIERKTIFEFKDLKKGDLLICDIKDLKSLIYGKIYVIEEKIEIPKKRTLYNGQTKIIKEEYIQFKGIKKKIKYSPYKFKPIPTDVQRQMNLDSLLEGKEIDIVTDIPQRKIDTFDNKNKELIELIAKAILDKSRHHYDVMGWVYNQSGKNMNVNENDYKELLNMKLIDVLKIID